jgi:N12 class adenine-specific DNA methylase
MDLNEARKRLPELAGLSDESALNVIHQVYYPNMERAALAERLGFKAPPPPTPDRSMARAAGDLGLQFAGGAVSGVRMMSDVFGANNAVSTGLRSAEDALRELQSAAAKADQQRIGEIMKEAESKGFADQVVAGVKAFGQAPAAMMAQALGTSIPTLATALIPGGAAARLAGAAAVGAGQGAGNIKGVIYEEVKNNPLPGETPEQTEFRAVRAQEYGGQNTGQIALGGGLGALAGSTGMERTLSGLRNGVTQAAPGMAARVGMGAVAEAVPEIAQGGQEKLASNLALGNEGFDVDPMAGVVAGATMEGLAGGVMGGAFGIPNPSVVNRDPLPVPPVEPAGPMTRALNVGAENAVQQMQDRAAVLAQEEVGEPMVPQAPIPDGRAVLELQQAQEQARRDAEMAANRAVQTPDDEILQSTGAMQDFMAREPAPQPVQPPAPEPVAAAPEPQRGLTDLSDDELRGYLRNAQDTGIRKTVSAELARRKREAMADPLAAQPAPQLAAEAEKPAEPVQPQPQSTDILNPKGLPFKTQKAAELAAKKTPGDVVPVAGGFVIRPMESTLANTAAQEVAPADAAPVQADEPAAAVSFADAADEDGGNAVLGSGEPTDLEALSNEQDAPQATTGAAVTTGAATTGAEATAVEEAAPARGDGAAAAGVPDAGAGAGVRADGVKRSMGRYGDAMTITQADAKVKELEKEARDLRKKAGEAPTKFMETTARDGATRAATLARKLRDDIKDAVGAYPDARFEFDSLKSGAGDVQADGVKPSAQFESYRKAVEEAETVGGGMVEQIRMDDRLEDGEAERLEQMAAPKTKAAKKLPFVSKEDGERLFGVPQKRQAAIDRIAKGTAYFGTKEKAREFITGNGIKDTHEFVQAKPGRFEIRAKAGDGTQTADVAPTEQTNDAPDWWKNKTPAERVWTLKASGFKGTAVTPWARISPADQKKLNDQWGPKEDAPAAAVKAGERVRDGKKTGTVDRIFKDGGEAMVQWDGDAAPTAADLAGLTPEPSAAPAPDPRPATPQVPNEPGTKYVLPSFATNGAPKSAPEPAADPARDSVVNVPKDVSEAMTGQMQKQKNRIARLKREAEASGMTLDEKRQAQTKVLAAETTLRKMRQTVFDAEDAAIKALASGNPDDFAAHTDVFSDAADVIQAQVAKPASPKPTPAANTIFTEDAAAAARALLKKKLSGGTLNSGIDPELMQAGITLAGYHIEKGARTFAAYAKAMLEDLGDGVKPYLKSWYAAVSLDPRAAGFSDGLTPLGDVMAADVDKLAPEADTGAPKDGNATQQLDRTGTGALGGTPTQDVRAADEGQQAGTGSDGSGRGDGGSDARPDDAGGNAGGSLGGDAGAVPVSRRGTRAGGKDAKKPRVPRKSRADEGMGLFGPAAGGLTPDDGANPAPNAPPIAPPQPTAQDFTITDELALGEGGEKTKFKNNVAAIRLMRDLEATGRMATPDEQAVLAKYVGWGGLSQAFDANNPNWTKEHAEITELMSPQELAAASRSTRYAHYTSREIIQDGVYAAMRHFGFTGGRTLEAGAGVGNFIGLMPADMRSAGRFTAVEREPFSSAIARQLYPQQNVQRADFTEFKGTDAYFDAAVGNPPFASDAQTDASGRKHLSGLSLHNYFFAKAVDMLREGGIMAQVVTNSFMDAKGDKARKYISDRAELLGAIRLPNNAFAKNAGTQVTTDLIFLKKRPDSEVGGKAARADAKRWMDTGIFTDEDGNRVALNQYFIDNPGMMLGKFGAYGTMYGPNKPALVARPGQDTLAMLKEAVGKLPAGVYKSIADTGADAMVSAAVVALKNPSVQEGGYFLEGDKLMQRLPDIAGEARGVEITPASPWTAKTTLGESGYQRIKALAGMRSTVRGLLAAEMADDAKEMKALRDTLNKQYDTYRDTHGLINDPSTLRVFDDDPDYPLLASLEHGYTPGIGPVAAKRMGVKPTTSTAKKGPIFTQRVVAARTAVQKVDTPADALAVSMAERGRLDAPYIGKLLGMEPEQVLQKLSTGDKPMLFRDPVTDEYVLRDAYLSGNVRAKLAQAKAASMFTNANALEAVQPEDVASHEIVARLGSPWVPTSVYEDFARTLFGEESKARVFYLQANSSYQISVQGASEVALTNTWGTNKYHGDELLQAVMNNRSIKVTYRDSEGKTHTDVDGTEKANEKATELKAKFNDWIFSDSDRSEVLTKAYNETNNNYVTRVYDGSAMTFPGKVPDSIIKFRRHQRNAIARIVQDRTALLDHVVGAGKTFTVISGAMELKRTGLARKPMVAVPNHLVKQWAADFYRLYPGANVLTATKKDFEKANRRKFLAKIATGDWDAVVIAHSSYGFIKPAPDFEAEFNNREVAKIMATIKAVEEDDGGDKQTKKRTIKQLEGMQERLENRIKALRDKPMDDLLDFEQIGVDQLFVDEAHMFKNLMFTTKMTGVAGLNDPSGSQRAYDMYVKTNQIMEKNGRGQGVVFATGTPVSNSLAEMYHMMRYLMPNQMRELGFESFDAWANTYASVDQVWMQAPSGDGFKAQNRMSNFVNTPELLKMFDQVSDTVTMDDIKKAYAEENNGAEFPLPKVKGGRRSPVSLEKSEAQNAYMDEIAKRAKEIEQRKGPPQKGDDNILVVMGDARKAAMDIRLVDPEVMNREAGGRIDRATDEVLARYKQYDSVKGTQLVFSDLGTPLKHAKKEMAEYEALQARIQGATEDVAASAALGNEAAMETMEDAEAAQAELDAMGADWLSSVKSALRGFSVYDDFRAALVEKGIPEAEIAFIHDYNTDDQKAWLFRKVNAGQIRVLLGSTAKLGAGTNVQERLVALHHLDVPWRPSDVEQREGRIERQGNRLMTEWPGFEVEILAYVTRDTLDMRMWQVQETKLKMINQLRTRKIGREIDNAFEDMELSAGEMQAAATGDINLLKEIQLRNDVKKLEQRKRAFDGQRNDLLSRKRRTADALRELPKKVEEAATEAKEVTQYLRDVQVNRPPFAMNIDGKDYTDADEAQKVLREKDEATEEITALNGEVTTKKAPLSVIIDGELIKNRATMAELFSNARGDVTPIAWTYNGETYRRRTVLANAIRAKVLDAIADETTQQVGDIGPYSVAVEGSTDKDGTPVLEVTMRRGGNVVMSNSMLVSDSARSADRVVTMVENLMASAVSEANYLTRRLEDAKKQQIDLDKAVVSDVWPDQGKLDAARAAHKEILGKLKQKDAVPGAAGDDAETSLSIDDSTGPADTANHGPATQAHRDAADRFSKAFGTRLGSSGPDSDLLDAVAPRADTKRGRSAASVAAVAEHLFNREVVFVKFRGEPKFNGAVSKAAPGFIFLNIDSQRPLMAVLGHELLHEMAKSQPAMYANLSRRLDALIKGETEYGIRLVKQYQKQGISTKGLDAREELEADIVGDNFMDAEFWRAMGEDQPGLFKRIVGYITRWLDALTEKLAGYRAFGTEEFLTDIAAARAAVADAMRQFSGAEAGAVADPVGGDVKLSAARGQNRGTEAEAIAAGFTMKAYRGVSASKPFNDTGTTWMTTSREVAEAYAEEVMGYEDPDVLTVMVKPDGLKRHDASRLTDEQREQMQADDFGNPQAIGIYDRSDDHPLGGSRRNVTVIHAPKDAVWVVDDGEKLSATGNAGTFDPDNADIRFSVADDIKKAIPAFDVKTAPKNTWAHYRGMAMQALGRRQIVDLYAEELPQLERYDDLVQQMDAEKNDTGAEADKLAQDWGKLKDEKQLAELMHDATLAQIDPAKPMETGVLQAQYRELKARFDALTPEAKTLYRQSRDMYDGHYRKVQQAIKERIERTEMSAGQKRQIMARMDEELFKKLKGVYFPLARFGDYVIVVKDANGEVKNVTRAEVINEAEEARKELHKAFPKHMGYTVGKVLKQAEFNAGRDAVGKGFMADLMDALDAKGIDDELRDTVAQLYLSSLPDLSWAKHGLHRKGTPGFSQDARRAFAQNMFHGARYLAKLRHADQLQDLLIEMQDHVRSYEGVDEYDSIAAQQVVDEMVKRHELMMNPKTSSLSTALTSFGFVFHLGLSPASAMVNMSQTALVAYPMMGAKWGWAKASAALLAASGDVVKSKNDLGTILKGAELDAYERAVKDGTIDVTMAHDLAGISQGEDQKVMWRIRPVMRAASFMFHHAERFNRQATFIAAWRMAKEAGPDKTADQLYEEAKKLTYDSHFDYAASNRPRLMQGNWQRVIFLFKQYAQAMVYTLSRNAYLSMKGASPADRKMARKTLGGILAAHAAAAGVLGLPLVGPLLTAASFIGSDDDEPWDAEVAMQNLMADMVGPKAAEVMARGFSRLTPFDLSGRVALNKLILPDVQEGLEGKQWAESAMAAALGPVAGIGVNWARGFQKITEGHYMMGLEDMMPTAIRAPLRAMRYQMEGAVDKTGVVVVDDVGAGSIVGQALGFAPSEVRRATERKAAIMDYDRSLADRRSSLVRQWAEAQMAGDTDGVQDLMADIRFFNQKNPNRKITMPNLIQSVRARRRRIEQAEDGVYLPRSREGAREAVRF